MTGLYDDVVERVSTILAEAIREREAEVDVLGVDAGVRRILRSVGLSTTRQLVQGVVAEVVATARERGFTVNRSAEVTVGCLYGDLTVSSPYMRQGVGNTTRPVRDLGLTHRSRTPALQRALTDFGIEDSFGLASSRFEEHYGWEIHRTSLLRVVHAVADDGLAYVEHRLAEEPEDVEPAAILLVEMDGCELRTGTMGSPHPTERTPVRGLPRRKRPTEWRDVRLAFCRDLHDDTDKTFVGGMSPFAEVVDQLHAAALHRGLSYRTLVATVLDGGNGLREAIEARFGDCIVVLDRPHVSQHLHDVAKHMGLADKERFAWVSRVLGDFYDGRVADVFAELNAYRGPGEPRVQRFLKHLWRFQDAVEYGFAHHFGIPQGSGEIESAHRYVPQKRMKLAGACWHPDSMNRMLALRIIRANGWWGDFWDHRASVQEAS